MANLFTIVILVSLITTAVFGIKSLLSIKKKKQNKKNLKITGISFVVAVAALAGVGITAPKEEDNKTTKSETYELSDEEIEILDKLEASLSEEQRKVERGNTLDGILDIHQGIKISEVDNGKRNLTITARMDEYDLVPIEAKEKTVKMMAALKKESGVYNIDNSVQFDWTLPNGKLNTESIYYILRFDADTVKNTDWSTVKAEDVEQLASYVSNDMKK